MNETTFYKNWDEGIRALTEAHKAAKKSAAEYLRAKAEGGNFLRKYGPVDMDEADARRWRDEVFQAFFKSWQRWNASRKAAALEAPF